MRLRCLIFTWKLPPVSQFSFYFTDKKNGNANFSATRLTLELGTNNFIVSKLLLISDKTVCVGLIQL